MDLPRTLLWRRRCGSQLRKWHASPSLYYRIIVIAIQAKRLERGRRLGLTDIIDSTKRGPVETSGMFFLKELMTCLISLG